MSQRINDMPDWLKPLYDEGMPEGSLNKASTAPSPQSTADMPDWLAYAYEQQDSPGAHPPAQTPPPASDHLTINNWLIVGVPSADMAQLLGSQRMLLDNVYLNLAREALTEAEKQIRSFYNQRGVMPDAIDMYKLRDVSEALKMYPVQVATLLADTILMASGEYETCGSELRHRGILGISQRILDYERSADSLSAATGRMTAEVLEAVEQGSIAEPGSGEEVRVHARKLLLGVIAGNDRR